MATRLIIGCGYLSTPVAKHWIAQGDQVFALTRSHDNAQRLRTLGIQPLLGDVMEPQSLPIFPAVEQVLYAVGYDRSGKYSLEDVYVQGLKNVVHRLPDSVQQLVYISSTGTHGQDDGSWVTETSETAPTRPGGKACLEAELFLLDKQAQAALLTRDHFTPCRNLWAESNSTTGTDKTGPASQGALDRLAQPDSCTGCCACRRLRHKSAA